MTWTQLQDGLSHVATRGTVHDLPLDTAATLLGLGYIAGSEGSDTGVYLTDSGRRCYHGGVMAREQAWITDRLKPGYRGKS